MLVVGDSFGFGWLLDDRNTIVARLQAAVDGTFGDGTFTLLNAATIGWGTADYVAFVEDFGGVIEPEIVLVLLSVDDIGRIPGSPVWNLSRPDLVTRVRGPRDRLKTVMNALPGYGWLLEHSHAVQLGRQTVLSSDASSSRPAYDEIAAAHVAGLGVSLFDRLGRWCRDHRAALIVTTLGWHDPPYTDETEPTEAFLVRAPAVFAELGVPYADPSARLAARMGGDLTRHTIPGDGHPDETGARMTADVVFPFVRSEFDAYCRRTRRCGA